MDTLVAAVVHDVKNQLAELALRLERRGDCGQENSLVLQACDRLTELLLALRQQAGQLQANIDSASPVDLLNELASEYRAMFMGIDIVEDHGKAPPFAFYDASLIRLALSNALHNACRHARSSVKISACSESGFLVFEVRDDGPGFSQDILQRALSTPLSVGSTSTGLGLWLAGRIAELHRLENRCGRVMLENAEGGCFRMMLP